MQTPIIHLNGTSADELLEGYLNACDRLHQAISTMQTIRPHGRDYYPAPGTWEVATEEHDARISKLLDVLAEMQQLAAHVAQEAK